MLEKSIDGPTVRNIVLFAIVIFPWYVNDFFYMASETAEDWLVADYVSKLAPLILVFAVPDFRRTVIKAFKRRVPIIEAIVISVGLMIGLILLNNLVKLPLDDWLPQTKLFVFPEIESKSLLIFDLTVGLMITAVSEEIVWRSLFWHLFTSLVASRAALYIASATLFALGHWSNGVGNVIFAFLAGVFLMAAFLKTGSLLPVIAGHYLTDLILFL